MLRDMIPPDHLLKVILRLPEPVRLRMGTIVLPRHSPPSGRVMAQPDEKPHIEPASHGLDVVEHDAFHEDDLGVFKVNVRRANLCSQIGKHLSRHQAERYPVLAGIHIVLPDLKIWRCSTVVGFDKV